MRPTTTSFPEEHELVSLPHQDEIHLWLADYDEIADEGLHTAYRTLLSGAEQEQEPRFYFARDRRRYLVTRALVRTVLSRYEPSVRPHEWKFESTAYGRPYAVNEAAGDLIFNISHTHSMIVLGVTRGRAFGVDVENVVSREISLDVASHFFAPREVADLTRVPAAGQQHRFFEYWTFKESYIKARGMGLSLPLDKFSFHYPDDDTVALEIHPELNDRPANWQFWQFRPSPGYLLAVCAERLGPEPAVIVRKTIPMHTEEQISPELLRLSAETADLAQILTFGD
jgi:4'-phosphopantetheinyl transferase